MTKRSPLVPVDLEREFLARPEGDVGATAIIVKPSLWAGLEAVTQLLVQLAPFLLGILVPLIFFGRIGRPDSGPDGPGFLVFAENADLSLGLLLTLGPVLRVAFTRYTFDETGIRVRSALLLKSEQRVPWNKVTALRHRRTIVGWMLGIEMIEIVAYGKRGPTLRLVGLRNAAALRSMVARRMRESATVGNLLSSD